MSSSPIKLLSALLIVASPQLSWAQTEAERHFERRVRPLLVKRCVGCHGAKKQESGLRLDSRRGLLKGGEIAGPTVRLKDVDRSPLLLAVRRVGDVEMPPDERLSQAEIADLRHWIADGLPWPNDETLSEVDASVAWRDHWAARPVQSPPIPLIEDQGRLLEPVDAFVAARLSVAGLTLSRTARPETLVRRAHFVLTGLPPSRSDVITFIEQYAVQPDRAMARLVDRLMASPHFGERWGRHWLDVARYADTKGYVRLQEQPAYYYAYTYRDYVVASFNSDRPFDQFVIEQLAADQLVEGADNRVLAALGFLTLGRRFTGNQHDVIDDRIDVVTRGLMGLTVTCARCHDHKFDPIPTDDYYALYGVFASTTEPSDLPYLGRTANRSVFDGDMAEYAKRRAELDDKIQSLLPATMDMLRDDTVRYLQAALVGRKQFLVPLPAAKGELRQTFVERWVEYLEGTKRSPHPVFALWHAMRDVPAEAWDDQFDHLLNRVPTNGRILSALRAARPRSMRAVAEVYGRQLVAVHRRWKETVAERPNAQRLADDSDEALRQVLYGDDSPFAISPREAIDAYLLDAEDNRDLAQAYLDFDAWLIGTGEAVDRAHVLFDSARVHEPHVFIRGNPERIGRRVRRAAPKLLGGDVARPFAQGSGRLELALSIVREDNPLTARVIVNRVWTQLWGRGLATSASNFGLRAKRPVQVVLLDFLAHRLIHEGWSLKRLMRTILLSRTWQQRSDVRPNCYAVDSENDLLWRAEPRRYDFETLRDSLLFVAGRLDRSVGGVPVGLDNPSNFRRTLYGHIDRSKLPSVLRLFDFPSPDTHSPRRARTIAPQQALFLLNNPFVLDRAADVARSVLQQGANQEQRVGRMYETVLQRPPSTDELSRCLDYLSEGGGLEELCQALLISNEFLFID